MAFHSGEVKAFLGNSISLCEVVGFRMRLRVLINQDSSRANICLRASGRWPEGFIVQCGEMRNPGAFCSPHNLIYLS